MVVFISKINFILFLTEASAQILGEPDKHVRSGSTFELICVLRDSTEPPVYVSLVICMDALLVFISIYLCIYLYFRLSGIIMRK